MVKRLLMISTDRKIFDEGSAVRARQAEYAKSWDEVHIIVFSGRGFFEQAISQNCWAYPTRSWTKWLYTFDAMRLGRFIVENKGITDITCQDSSLTAMVGVSLKKSAAKRGKALSLEIQVHEDIGAMHYAFNISNRIRKALALSYIPKVDHIRVVSERIKKYIESILPVSGFLPVRQTGLPRTPTIEVRPINVDIEAVKNAPIMTGADLHKKYPQFDNIILVVGRLEPEKNVSLAVDAFALVMARAPKIGLIIVGRGSQLNSLKDAASRITPRSSIIFEGWADKATLYSYYKTADLLLNTSLFEGYGMALVEAHAAGCPIVSTDVGVAREMSATIIDWDARSVADGIVDVLARMSGARALK